MEGIFRSLNLQIGGVDVSSNYVQAGVVIALVFLVILIMAKATRSYMSWYTSGWWIWMVLGFLLAVAIEGFFVINGSTVFTAFLGWKDAPKPIRAVVDSGRENLVKVLGESDNEPNRETLLTDYSSLDPEVASEVKENICRDE